MYYGSHVILISYEKDIPPQTQKEGKGEEDTRGGEVYQVIFKTHSLTFGSFSLTLLTRGLKAAASGVWKAASSP